MLKDIKINVIIKKNGKEHFMKLEIGKSIKKLRKDKGISQEQFSDILGVSCQSVSRWENDVCYPDIELIPVIASYFGVTVDELICARSISDKNKINKLLSEHKNLVSNGKIKESIKLAKSGASEYPANLDIAVCLMYSLFIYCHNTALASDKLQEYDEEIILLANRIIKNSDNIDTILQTKSRLAFHHYKMGRKKEGRKLYEELPSVLLCREMRILSLLEDKEKIPAAQDLIRKSYNILSKAMWDLAINCSIPVKTALTILEKREQLDELIYDDEFPNYTWDKVLSHIEAAKLYIKENNHSIAISHLKIAMQFALDYDKRPKEKIFHSALLGNFSKNRNDYASADMRTLSTIMKDDWLKSSEFDSVRNTDEFLNIIVNLSL